MVNTPREIFPAGKKKLRNQYIYEYIDDNLPLNCYLLERKEYGHLTEFSR